MLIFFFILILSPLLVRGNECHLDPETSCTTYCPYAGCQLQMSTEIPVDVTIWSLTGDLIRSYSATDHLNVYYPVSIKTVFTAGDRGTVVYYDYFSYVEWPFLMVQYFLILIFFCFLLACCASLSVGCVHLVRRAIDRKRKYNSINESEGNREIGDQAL